MPPTSDREPGSARARSGESASSRRSSRSKRPARIHRRLTRRGESLDLGTEGRGSGGYRRVGQALDDDVEHPEELGLSLLHLRCRGSPCLGLGAHAERPIAGAEVQRWELRCRSKARRDRLSAGRQLTKRGLVGGRAAVNSVDVSQLRAHQIDGGPHFVRRNQPRRRRLLELLEIADTRGQQRPLGIIALPIDAATQPRCVVQHPRVAMSQAARLSPSARVGLNLRAAAAKPIARHLLGEHQQIGLHEVGFSADQPILQVAAGAVTVEGHRLKSASIGRLLVTALARVPSGLRGFDHVSIVIELEAHAGRRPRAHHRELRVPAERSKLMTRCALPIVDGPRRVIPPAMIGMTRGTLEHLGAIGQASIAAAKQHVRGVQEAIRP